MASYNTKGKSTIVVQTSMVSDPFKWFCHVRTLYKISYFYVNLICSHKFFNLRNCILIMVDLIKVYLFIYFLHWYINKGLTYGKAFTWDYEFKCSCFTIKFLLISQLFLSESCYVSSSNNLLIMGNRIQQ